MLDFLYKYGSNTHSQNGEDGCVQETVRRLGLSSGLAVEIGGADGRWLSNTRLLIEQGWSGLFVETDYALYQKCAVNWKDNPRVRCQCSHVDGQNVNAFVKDDCDLLSLDTDGGDYKIFQGLEAKPKIVIVEIDSSIPPYLIEFNADGGAGYAAMVILAYRKGYFLLCHTGNLVLVRNDYKKLFPEITANPLSECFEYFNPAWLRAA